MAEQIFILKEGIAWVWVHGFSDTILENSELTRTLHTYLKLKGWLYEYTVHAADPPPSPNLE